MAATRESARTGRVISPYRDRPDDETVRRGSIIEGLQYTLSQEETLRLFPRCLAEALREDAWRHFCDTTTNVQYRWSDFDAFVRAKRPSGLGVEGGIWQLHNECRFYADQGNEHATAALAELDKMLPAQPTHAEAGAKGGRGKKAERNTASFRSDTRTGHLARLKRDRPDLAERVIAGELSANRAAVEAGFRARMMQIPATVEGFKRAIGKYLDATARAELKEWL